MKYLAVDTSGEYLTIVLSNGQKTSSFFSSDDKVKHSLTLMPNVEKLIDSLNFSLSQCDFFCAVVGPGSFTGIRIGVSTIKAFCDAFNKPSLAVTAFDVLAYNNLEGKILAVIDAKHNNYYVCGYENGKIIFEPKFISEEELNVLEKDFKLVSSSKIENHQTTIVSVEEGLKNAVLLKKSETQDANNLKPFYLRLSQAEEGRP